MYFLETLKLAFGGPHASAREMAGATFWLVFALAVMAACGI